MNTNNKYTGRVLCLVALLLTNLITGCDNNNIATPEAAAAPTVIETSSANTILAVALNSKVTETFSEAMDANTIDTTSFTIIGAGEPALTGTVSFDAASNTVSFTPNSNLTPGTVYTATLTTTITDHAVPANPLAAYIVWRALPPARLLPPGLPQSISEQRETLSF